MLRRVVHSWPVYLLVEFAGAVLLPGLAGTLFIVMLPRSQFASAFGQGIAAGVAVLLLYLACRFWERRSPADAGLVSQRVFRDGLLGLLAGVAGFAVVVGILALAGWYRVGRVMPIESSLGVLTSLLVFFAAAALLEEVIFRSIVYRHLERGLGTWAAVAISAALFGAVHFANPNATLWSAVAIALTAGLMLAALFAVTRSLWMVTGLHLGWNFAQGPIFGAAVSGMADLPSLIEPVIEGPVLFTGGAFGPEASIITVLLWGSIGAILLAVASNRGMVYPPAWVRRSPSSDLPVSAASSASGRSTTGH